MKGQFFPDVILLNRNRNHGPLCKRNKVPETDNSYNGSVHRDPAPSACHPPPQAVQVGQVIASAHTESSLPLHATISGTVAAIKGMPTPCLILEADGTDTWIASPQEETDLEHLAPSEIINRIHAAGLITRQLVPAPLTTDLVPIDQPKSHLIDGTRITRKIEPLIESHPWG